MSKPKERGTLGIRLANGKELINGTPEEVANFYESGGTRITEMPKRKKGGKSKGARNRTQPKVRQPRFAKP